MNNHIAGKTVVISGASSGPGEVAVQACDRVDVIIHKGV